jgi:hypothetical protein
MLQELAKFALDGFARLHTDYGIPDTMALMAIAQRIDGYLMRAYTPVVDLHLAFDFGTGADRQRGRWRGEC